MVAFRSLARYLSLLLLLVAAMDLSYPAGCADALAVPPSTARLCAGDHAPDAGHDGDDCFCCSRTVRAEGVGLLHCTPLVIGVRSDAPASLVSALGPPPYHPPLG